jgi:histidinol-phosphatase
MNWDEDLALAHRLADLAAPVAMSFFRRDPRNWSKQDGSLVTEADLAVEQLIRDHIATVRRDDAVLGEEQGQTGESGRRWIVDAIDGTVDFAQGNPDWGTLIALDADGEIVVAVCDQPAHKRRYWAHRGGGAFVSDASSPNRRLRVSDARDLASARSFVPPATWVPNDDAFRLAQRVGNATAPGPHTEHPALQVASGGYEVVLFFLGGPWDLAAPALIVEEAGGRFTDARGRKDLFSGSALFSNGHLHDAVLELIAHEPQ